MSKIKSGDTVQIRKFNNIPGGWTQQMKNIMGQKATVTNVKSHGDALNEIYVKNISGYFFEHELIQETFNTFNDKDFMI